MAIAVVLGTRPEIIKLAPVLRELSRRRLPYLLIHTNQHYSESLDQVFFRDLALPSPDVSLGVGSHGHGVQTGHILGRLEPVLIERRPVCVLVQGDTNSVLAGALVAAKLGIPVGHVEAGLRSGDRSMPEELNRIVADHLSTWLFAPTPGAVATLASEGIAGDRVVMTGNTVVDALVQNRALAVQREPGLDPGRYLVLTLHRAENTDRRERLAEIVTALEEVLAEHRLPLVFPVHPRAAKMLAHFGLADRLRRQPGLRWLEPLDYLGFLGLEAGAACILTDSGGVQEEACVLGVPCVTLRDSTERPETVEVGANRLVGASREAITAGVRSALGGSTGERNWSNPFGDGQAAARIVSFLESVRGV